MKTRKAVARLALLFVLCLSVSGCGSDPTCHDACTKATICAQEMGMGPLPYNLCMIPCEYPRTAEEIRARDCVLRCDPDAPCSAYILCALACAPQP